jgi:hypothetical protein
MLGVRTSTIARWARDGLLKSTVQTPGGHRRYRRADVRVAQQAAGSEELQANQRRIEQDAVRLYEQGWPIRRVAEQFGMGYGPMRRILSKHTPLRGRGGAMRHISTE